MEEIVIVCIVPRLKDWDILLNEHCYHIHLKKCVKRIGKLGREI